MNAKRLAASMFAAVICAIPMAAQTEQPATPEGEQSEIQALREEVAGLKSEMSEMEQNEVQDRLWKYGRYKRLVFAIQSMECPELQMKWKPKFGVGLQIGNTYHLPHKAFGGIVKIGIDATWFDFNYYYYGKGNYSMPDMDNEFTSGYGSSAYDSAMEEAENLMSKIGVHQLAIGMGVGPSINIAPFAHSQNEALQYLKAQVYGHFIPSLSMILHDNNEGEMSVDMAFLPQWACGLSVNWKQFGLGFEGRWGSAKYKSLVNSGSLADDGSSSSTDVSSNNKFKNAAFRIYLNFHF